MDEYQTSQVFENEKYTCKSCVSFIDAEDIKGWKCPNCGNRVLIEIVTDVNTYVLVRVLPSELEDSDFVYVRNAGFHNVLSIRDKFIGERIYANLEGYGSIEFKDVWINVMWNDNHIVY